MKNLGSFRRDKSYEIKITVRGHPKSMYVLKGERVPKKHTKTYREGALQRTHVRSRNIQTEITCEAASINKTEF